MSHLVDARQLTPAERLRVLKDHVDDLRFIVPDPGCDEPTEKMLKKSEAIGELLERHGILSDAINLGATDDGELLFSLFGDGEKRADLWIEDDGTVVISRWGTGSNITDDAPVSTDVDKDVAELAEWLKAP